MSRNSCCYHYSKWWRKQTETMLTKQQQNYAGVDFLHHLKKRPPSINHSGTNSITAIIVIIHVRRDMPAPWDKVYGAIESDLWARQAVKWYHDFYDVKSCFHRSPSCCRSRIIWSNCSFVISPFAYLLSPLTIDAVVNPSVIFPFGSVPANILLLGGMSFASFAVRPPWKDLLSKIDWNQCTSI